VEVVVIGCDANDQPNLEGISQNNIRSFFLSQFVDSPEDNFEGLHFIHRNKVIELSKVADKLTNQWYISKRGVDVSTYEGHSIGDMIKVSLFYKILDYLLFIEVVSGFIINSSCKNIYVSSILYDDLYDEVRVKCTKYERSEKSVWKDVFLGYMSNLKKYLFHFRFSNNILKHDYVFVFDKNIDAISNLSKYIELSGGKCCSISNRDMDGATSIKNKYFFTNPFFLFKILSHIKSMRKHKILGYNIIGFFVSEIMYSVMTNYIVIKNVKNYFNCFNNTATFITATDVHPFSIAVINEAKKHGNKSIQIQHGSLDNSFYSKVAFVPLRSDQFYVWGGLFKQTLIDFGVKKKDIVTVGCLLSSLNEISDDKVPVQKSIHCYKILYISANHTGPIKSYYITQVVDAILEAKFNIELIIRTHPGSNDVYEFYNTIIKKYNSKHLNIKLDKNQSLENSLKEVNLVINVGLSSTHIKSVILNKNSIAYIPFSFYKAQVSIGCIANSKIKLLEMIEHFYRADKIQYITNSDIKYSIYGYGKEALENAYESIIAIN